MDRTAGQKRTSGAFLYPPIDRFDQRLLDMGDGHQVYVEQSGNPDGVPVVVCHGGPGGGCSPAMRRYFDPAFYRIVLFDQRGCGLSRPYASVAANTTKDLIADMERIRTVLGIERWACFGGSWGATLALLYAQAHPARVLHLVLRGVFLAEQTELDWFYGGGAARFFPDLWARFTDVIPKAEHEDLIAAYHQRLFSGHYPTEARYGRAWANWENALATVDPDFPLGEAPSDYARAFARLENHYFVHHCFIDEGQILRDKHLISHIGADIVQGRQDMICPPASAWRLAQGWEKARLQLVQASGHALSEPRISAALVEATDRLRETLQRTP
jgi:proline iminopeptidase